MQRRQACEQRKYMKVVEGGSTHRALPLQFLVHNLIKLCGQYEHGSQSLHPASVGIYRAMEPLTSILYLAV